MSQLFFLLLLLAAAATVLPSETSCRRGCNLALGSYYLDPNLQLNLTYIASLFGQTVQDVLPYNPAIPNPDYIVSGTSVNISLTTCDCVDGNSASLGHTFSYTVQTGDTYDIIASTVYSNLTTTAALEGENSYPAVNIPDRARINVTISCYCGDAAISKDYGLFITNPLQPGQTLASVAANFSFSGQEALLRSYNPGNNFSGGIVYIPVKDQYGSYRPLQSRSGVSAGALAGISIAVIAALIIPICIYVRVYKRKKAKKATLLTATYEDRSTQSTVGVLLQTRNAYKATDLNMDRSVEFTYEELAKATNDFNLANKIGQGGFGTVYYAELREEKAAIKKMDMEASREFLAELKVLTHVHHLNLVRLIGFCIEESLFLVYEYIENGNLSQHLHGRGRDALPWPARVQVALDSARGLEYIHEHTVPVYIHRDIKSANILLDDKLRAKVADFGLTKLTEVGNASVSTRLVGTFGYMPPEYAQYGDVSPKVDVYAFGVVLYELISAKEAIIRSDLSIDSKGLVALFLEALDQSDPKEHLKILVDPRLGDGYPIDSVLLMAQIAKACTEENPQLRPSMRSIVVALMALMSSSYDWDVGHFYANQAIVNLMSGR